MAVINLRKDGSVIEYMSKVTIQNEAVYDLIRSMQRGRKNEEDISNNNNNDRNDSVSA